MFLVAMHVTWTFEYISYKLTPDDAKLITRQTIHCTG